MDESGRQNDAEVIFFAVKPYTRRTRSIVVRIGQNKTLRRLTVHVFPHKGEPGTG